MVLKSLCSVPCNENVFGDISENLNSESEMDDDTIMEGRGILVLFDC